jgi:hypothetical protein
MTDVRPFPKTDTKEKINSLIVCPNCNVEMSLFGVEAESDARDLYTFECRGCDVVEVKGVRANKTPPIVIVAKVDDLRANGKAHRSPRR